MVLLSCTVVLLVGYASYRGYKIWKQSHWMAMAKETVAADCEQNDPDDQPKTTGRDNPAQHAGGANGYGNRQSVPRRDRNQGPRHRNAALLLHAERDGEQPAHAGVDAVVGAQEKQSPTPRPRVVHA